MIKDTKEALELLKEYGTMKEIKKAIKDQTYHDWFSEIADSNVDVYTHSLFEWLMLDDKNIWAVNDAIKEYGFPKDEDGEPSLVRAIMQGQYKMNEEMLYKAINEL